VSLRWNFSDTDLLASRLSGTGFCMSDAPHITDPTNVHASKKQHTYTQLAYPFFIQGTAMQYSHLNFDKYITSHYVTPLKTLTHST